jgi:CheY-like chemotaxis protein
LRQKPIGQLLVQRGVLPPLKLRDALESQRRSGNRLASECHALGHASEEDLLVALSDQVGVPGIQMSNLVLPLAVLDILPEAAAAKQQVLPVRMDADRVFLAMADPHDSGTVSELAFLSNRKVVACVAMQGPLKRAIADSYAAKRRGELDYRGEHALEADASLVPVTFVCPRELARVPPELSHPPPAEPPAPAATAAPLQPARSAEIVIRVDDAAGDFVVSFEGDDPALSEQAVTPLSPPPLVGEEITERGLASPDVPAVHPSTTPSRSSPAINAKVTALIVDDDPELRRLAVRVLEAKGIEVEEAGRGLEALSRIKNAPPDLIILDAMLPEIHGFDICRKIKASDRYGSIPVIMISSVYRGWRFARDLKDSYGVEAFIEKPFTIDVLWNTVERVLASNRRLPRNNRRSVAKAEECMRHALRCYQAGELDNAIEACREGIKSDPLSASLHHRLGLFYLKKSGMAYQALQELEEAVALDPELFAAERSLAILYQRKGFKNKAIDMWERALRASPSDEVREQIRNHLKTLL